MENDNCVTIHFENNEAAEKYFKAFKGVKGAKLISKSNPAKEITTLKDQLKREMDCVDFYANGNGGNEDDSEMMPASNECPFAGEQLGKYARETQLQRGIKNGK